MNKFDSAAALDPRRSVVIEACAGSGKTWLLVSRILRLLLDGVAPGEILAITFTRKAAQEMEARLRGWLEQLATADDAEVDAFLRERAVPAADLDRLRPVARGLLERLLTADPGLTLNTFHGWFLQLLRNAPLESGFSGAPSLVEATSTLIEEAWQSFAENLQDNPDSPAAQALDTLFTQAGLHNTRLLLEDFVAKRGEWWAYTQGQDAPVDWALERLREEWNVDPDASPLAELFATPGLEGDLQAYLGLLEYASSKTDQAQAATLRSTLHQWAATQEVFDALRPIFLTRENTARQRKVSKELEKQIGIDGGERLVNLHTAMAERFIATLNALTAQAAYRFNQAALTCGAALLAHYQDIKAGQNALDFGDVEWHAYRLLAVSDHAEYMQYKLGSRYTHILLDEFQDTNPLQWLTLKAWLDASAAAGLKPGVFLVGDPKQSIYRFRRAEPRLFDTAARFLQDEYGAIRLAQNASYRCAPAVIATVNQVFAAEESYTLFQPHVARQTALAGGVEVLGIKDEGGNSKDEGGRMKDEEKTREATGLHPSSLILHPSAPLHPSSLIPHPSLLRNPLTTPAPDEEDLRHEQEAEAVASRLLDIIGHWHVAGDGAARPAEFRDIMLLVRRRTHVDAYERALKAARIPYVSTRRGGLLETLECRDLTALLEFLAAPFADLKLFHILRSPLFACGNDALLRLARRTEANAWLRLAAQAKEESGTPLTRAHRLIASWLARADTLPTHDLLDRVFFEGNVLQRYRDAVPEAQRDAVLANLHAFMELALAVDSGRYPSLMKFLRELASLRQAAEQESPNEGNVGDAANAVRIHTVHEAKGLEAPIVWLLDANAAERNERGYRLLAEWPPEAAAPSHFSALARKETRVPGQQEALEREDATEARENLNLLYVALTRAKQALFVSGAPSQRATDSWHAKATRAIGEVSTPLGGQFIPAVRAETAAPPAITLPAVDPRLTQPLNVGQRDTAQPSAAQRFGIRLHALLEWLTPPGAITGKTALRHRLGLDEEEFEPVWQAAQAMVEAPALRRFFDPAAYRRAWKELPYRNAAGETRRIDRLVELDDALWVLDYKSGGSSADAYRAQLEEYRRAVALVFPGKPVRCLLIYDAEQIIEITPTSG